MSQLDTRIGPKIKAFRRQLGIQANKLADQLNISPSYLTLIEGGKRKIDADLLIRICEELKIEISLGKGAFEATAWGCNLTKEYVAINADYTT